MRLSKNHLIIVIFIHSMVFVNIDIHFFLDFSVQIGYSNGVILFQKFRIETNVNKIISVTKFGQNAPFKISTSYFAMTKFKWRHFIKVEAFNLHEGINN